MTDRPEETAARLEAALAARADASARTAAGAPAQREGLAATGTTLSRPADLTSGPLPTSTRRRRAALTAVTGSVLAVAATAAVALVLDPGSSADRGSGGRPALGTRSSAAATPPPAPARPSVRATAVALSAGAGRQALLSAGDARVRAGDPAVGPTQYLLQRTQDPMSAGSRVYTIDQTWAPSGKARDWVRIQRQSDAATDEFRLAGVCNDLYQNTQDPPAGKGCGRPGDFTDLSPHFLSALPRDPGQLYSALRADAEASRNPEKVHDADYLALMDADSLFTSDALSADLAGALVKSLTNIGSARVLQHVTTCKGRSGLGVQVSATSGRGEGATHDTLGIIIDPDTGAYLGSYDGSPNTTGYSASDVTTTVVDEAPPAT